MNAAFDLLIVPELANKQFAYSGIDSLDNCKDKELFIHWPHSIEYKYNTRGFRDQEWPKDLESAVWCLGDSFTAGLGSCIAHTWPQVLSRHSQSRVINVSMDGASNEWIARTACDAYDLARPRNMVVMWSYLHRRERANAKLSSMYRRLNSIRSTVTQDFENLHSCRKLVQTHCADSNIIELAIPGFVVEYFDNNDWKRIRDTSWPQLLPTTLKEFLDLSPEIIMELRTLHGVNIDHIIELYTIYQQNPEFLADIVRVKNLDRARDGHHFDLVTAEWVATQVQNLLNL
jgi:hypothetical protein